MPSNIDIFSLIFRYNLEDPPVTEKCRTAIKPILLYFNLCPRVTFDYLHQYPFLLEFKYFLEKFVIFLC